MDSADTPRRGDRDGRGNLSLDALTHFTEWFLSIMLDQIRFAAAIFDMGPLQDRYARLIGDLYPGKDRLPHLVVHVLRHGEMARVDAHPVTGASERAAQNDFSTLLGAGFLKSTTRKAPVRIAFPLAFHERLFPNLFPDAGPILPPPPC